MALPRTFILPVALLSLLASCRSPVAPAPVLSVVPPVQAVQVAGLPNLSFRIYGNIDWTAFSSAAWLRITGSVKGTASMATPFAVTYSVSSNFFGTGPRTATVTVEGSGIGVLFTVNQDGPTSALSVSPAPAAMAGRPALTTVLGFDSIK
jgi:hypothetical protein